MRVANDLQLPIDESLLLEDELHPKGIIRQHKEDPLLDLGHASRRNLQGSVFTKHHEAGLRNHGPS